MIFVYIIFAAASSSLLVSGSSLHTSGRKEHAGYQWQMDIGRLQTKIPEGFQNSIRENQHREMLSAFERFFNRSLFMTMMRRQFQLNGDQGESPVPVQRPAQNKGIPFGYSGSTELVQRLYSKRTTLPLATGQAPLSDLSYRVHSAAQYGTDQNTALSQRQPGPSPPSQHAPSLLPNGPDGTTRLKPDQGPLRSFPPREASSSEQSSEESSESSEEFLPRGLGRPGGQPGGRFPTWNTGGGNRTFPSSAPPGQDSSEESQRSQIREDSQSGGQREQFPRDLDRQGQFPHRRRPASFFIEREQDQAPSSESARNIPEYDLEDLFGRRPLANQTRLD